MTIDSIVNELLGKVHPKRLGCFSNDDRTVIFGATKEWAAKLNQLYEDFTLIEKIRSALPDEANVTAGQLLRAIDQLISEHACRYTSDPKALRMLESLLLVRLRGLRKSDTDVLSLGAVVSCLMEFSRGLGLVDPIVTSPTSVSIGHRGTTSIITIQMELSENSHLVTYFKQLTNSRPNSIGSAPTSSSPSEENRSEP
jgi:hypothetical protein